MARSTQQPRAGAEPDPTADSGDRAERARAVQDAGVSADPSVALWAPTGAGRCAFNGVEYDVLDGRLTVPAAAVDALLLHGFRR